MRLSRTGRLAACTALALSAGMLLSGTASADGAPPAPHTAVTPAKPEAARPTGTLPKGTAHRKAGAVAPAAPAKPRADMDGDGYSDLFYRTPSGKLWLRTFVKGKEDVEYTFADQTEWQKDVLAPGDLNGDGHPELLTLSSTGTLSLYTNPSAGYAGYRTWSGGGWNAYNKLLTPGDVTGDGKMDVLARTPGGDLYLYPGNGSADADPFAGRIKVGGGWGAYDQLLGANDVNGDGIADVLARTPGGDLYVYAGTGDSAAPLRGRVKVGGGWDTYNQLLSMDDANGDGYADVFARTAGGTVYLYLADGHGNFQDRRYWGEGWEAGSWFGSQGGNPFLGKSEILARNTQGTLFYYSATNNGQLGSRQQVGDTGGWAHADVRFASSLDSDGQPELLEIYQNWLYNRGTAVSGGWGAYNLVVGPGDLNNDGQGDLLARDGSGTLWLQRGNGNGTGFASRLKVGGGWNAYDKIVGAGDLTGDGLADVVARTGDGKLYLYAGTGVSTSPFKSRLYVGPGWQQFKNLAAPGDINGDGRGDLLASNSRGELFRYSSNGYGGFQPRVKLGDGWNTYRDLY
ncbi:MULTISPECIES: VCBS repeat-containing protein [unclassified Streptomyces]|uniref:FG-GAP repeat domain-containing protein n=1 Tax=unclassified Streptomyces TaxID=2593676 RepID=UPI0034098011